MEASVFLNKIKDENLRQFAQDILQDGFDIIHTEWREPEKAVRYFDIHKNNRFGHVTMDWLGCYSISWKYPPQTHWGTAHWCEDLDELPQITLDDAWQWLRATPPVGPRYFTSIDEALNQSIGEGRHLIKGSHEAKK